MKQIGVHGYARQYGIDNTKEDFITFIDADDTFYEACSLSLLSKPIKDTSTKFVISPFIQIGKNCEQAPMNANLVWVFGHIYRRSFYNNIILDLHLQEVMKMLDLIQCAI